MSKAKYDYIMDYIADKDTYKAVMFACRMIRQGTNYNQAIRTACKGRTPWNKGIKMSEEFCKKCSESAKNRKDGRFNGNQYVDAYGNRK